MSYQIGSIANLLSSSNKKNKKRLVNEDEDPQYINQKMVKKDRNMTERIKQEWNITEDVPNIMYGVEKTKKSNKKRKISDVENIQESVNVSPTKIKKKKHSIDSALNVDVQVVAAQEKKKVKKDKITFDSKSTEKTGKAYDKTPHHVKSKKLTNVTAGKVLNFDLGNTTNEDVSPSPLKKKKRFEMNTSKENVILEDQEGKSEFQKNAERRVKNKLKKRDGEDINRRTIFIGNLPHLITRDKLKKTFKQFGKIESVRFRCAAVSDAKVSKKLAIIKKDFHTKRTNISAFIKFLSEESAKSSLVANGTVISDHHIRVDLADKSEKEKMDDNKAIFVGNLPFDVEEDDLWNFFETCGSVHSVRVIRDSKTSIGKGIGYVNFQGAESVELALQLGGQDLKGREIRVNRCAGKKKFKGSKERHDTPKKRKFNFTPEKKKAPINRDNTPKSFSFSGKEAVLKQKKKKTLINKEDRKKNKLAKILNPSLKSKKISS